MQDELISERTWLSELKSVADSASKPAKLEANLQMKLFSDREDTAQSAEHYVTRALTF